MRKLASTKKTYLTVNETAAALGISKQTLIRYEQRGIFPKPNRNQVNRWREYTLKDLQVLQKIMGRD
jgi:DNA-binding transcriptional MerR regulator